MAQPIYSTSVRIDSFRGLNQTGTGANMDMRFAAEMENVNVHNGEFAPMREGLRLAQELDEPIGTLAYLSRRYVENPDTLLVAISDGKVFTKELDGDDDWVQRYSGLTENDCDWITYESGMYPVYAQRPYIVGERCTHTNVIEPEPIPPVQTGISVYSRTYAAGKIWDTHWREVNSYRNQSGEYSNYVPLYSQDNSYPLYAYCAVEDTSGNDETKNYNIYYSLTNIPAGEAWTPYHWKKHNDVPIPVFVDGTQYNTGSRVCLEIFEEQEQPEPIVETKTYRCTTAIPAAEEWDGTNWEEITMGDPVDVLLFTNAKDGMYCLYGDTMDVVPVWVTPDPENNPDENIRFGIIARYNERIWGSGIDGDPDKLMYSVPYSPFDWTLNEEIPEDGAGDILQPTWDGDSFISLRQFGSDLMAIKRNSIWRIYGTHPGEFVMVRQYGGGTIEENTVAVQDQYMYMLGEHGLMRYDSIGAYAFNQDAVQRLMADMVNRDALSTACGAMRNGVYCLALPVNDSEYCNAVLEYDPLERTFALRTDVSVDSFLQIGERLFYTSATEPGRVFEMQDLIGSPLPCTWISGYQDLGLKNSIKSAFILYMMVESEAPVEMRVGIRTEKKLKQKIIYTKPGKMTRLHLNNQGREFRLEIRSYSAVPFTIAGGVKIDLELDPD